MREWVGNVGDPELKLALALALGANADDEYDERWKGGIGGDANEDMSRDLSVGGFWDGEEEDKGAAGVE